MLHGTVFGTIIPKQRGQWKTCLVGQGDKGKEMYVGKGIDESSFKMYVGKGIDESSFTQVKSLIEACKVLSLLPLIS